MARQLIKWKQGDLLPEVTVTLSDGSGPFDLTGCTVKFIMRQIGAAVPKIDAAASILSATTGRVRYTPSGTDTDTVGDYEAEFEVTKSGKKITFPNEDYMPAKITDDLG